MAMKKNESFPFSLEQVAREGFGAAAWTKEDGSRLWIERSADGFEAASFWGGSFALGATWKWAGEPGSSACVLSGTSGPAGDAMEAAGLSTTAKHRRVMDVMGAMAMGKGTFACADWDEWKAVKEAGLGFADKDGAWGRLSGPVADAEGDKSAVAAVATVVPVSRGSYGR